MAGDTAGARLPKIGPRLAKTSQGPFLACGKKSSSALTPIKHR